MLVPQWTVKKVISITHGFRSSGKVGQGMADRTERTQVQSVVFWVVEHEQNLHTEQQDTGELCRAETLKYIISWKWRHRAVKNIFGMLAYIAQSIMLALAISPGYRQSSESSHGPHSAWLFLDSWKGHHSTWIRDSNSFSDTLTTVLGPFLYPHRTKKCHHFCCQFPPGPCIYQLHHWQFPSLAGHTLISGWPPASQTHISLLRAREQLQHLGNSERSFCIGKRWKSTDQLLVN